MQDGSLLRVVARALREPVLSAKAELSARAELSAKALATRVGLGLAASGFALAGARWLGSRHANGKQSARPEVSMYTPEGAPEAIKVLTYNVIWTITDFTEHPGCSGSPTCLQRVCKFIDSNAGDCDFIGIQEYSDTENLQKLSSKLNRMSHTHFGYTGDLKKFGPVTFYDTKYKLDDEHSRLKFWFGTVGRGIQISFFRGNLCVINVHPGHRKGENKIHTFDRHLKKHLDTYAKEDREEYVKKLREYDIIMLGDMNDDATNFRSIEVDGTQRSLSGRTLVATCCGDEETLTGKGHRIAYDHVLCTGNLVGTSEVLVTEDLHSDHYPVIATLRRQ